MNSSKYNFNPNLHANELKPLLCQLDQALLSPNPNLNQLIKQFTKTDGSFFSKSEIISGYKQFSSELKLKSSSQQFISHLIKKPIRSQSGVTPVSVLTKPYPCPGKCIFCPSDIRMPKSYLADEPGAQRAARNAFDPYLQTYNRLKTLAENGHSVAKIELIILGGTWSYYPRPYQIWFIKRCFDALNDFSEGQDRRDQAKSSFQPPPDPSFTTTSYNQQISQLLLKQSNQSNSLLNSWESASWQELFQAHRKNETATSRNVGLVIETRPDNISPEEVLHLRRLGCTKTQIGYQSLSDRILKLNHRGHTVAATRRAMRLLRQAGFKIQAHWMPNLYGSTPKKDIQDFKKIFSDPDFKPDELKIYPTSLIQTAELMDYYRQGKWQPYTHRQLLEVITQCLSLTPEYCRLSRIIRDIPATDIVSGNKKSNFRQIAQDYLARRNIPVQDIRAREIRNKPLNPATLKLKDTTYQTSTSTEHFLQSITPENNLVGFLRLSLPQSGRGSTSPNSNFPTSELFNSAIIREVHVYGIAADIGEKATHKRQHTGIGSKLIKQAQKLAKTKGYANLAVISAVGTREYYRKLGFADGELYQHLKLS